MESASGLFIASRTFHEVHSPFPRVYLTLHTLTVGLPGLGTSAGVIYPCDSENILNVLWPCSDSSNRSQKDAEEGWCIHMSSSGKRAFGEAFLGAGVSWCLLNAVRKSVTPELLVPVQGSLAGNQRWAHVVTHSLLRVISHIPLQSLWPRFRCQWHREIIDGDLDRGLRRGQEDTSGLGRRKQKPHWSLRDDMCHRWNIPARAEMLCGTPPWKLYEFDAVVKCVFHVIKSSSNFLFWLCLNLQANNSP